MKKPRTTLKSVVFNCSLALTSSVLVVGCSGSGDPDKDSGSAKMHPETTASSIFVHKGDVYVAGTHYLPTDGTPQGKPTAMLWKNGEMLYQGALKSSAVSVAANGKAAYFVGETAPANLAPAPIPNPQHAIIWVNGIIQTFDHSDGALGSSASSVFVDGDDVYVAVNVSYQFGRSPVLLKNGHRVGLSEANSNPYAVSVHVSDGDVYVCGVEDTDDAPSVVVWKNDQKTRLNSVGTRLPNSNSFFVCNNDVYMAGAVSNQSLGTDGIATNNAYAVLWKNGIRQNLTDGNSPAEATSVFVFGEDIYVLGGIGEPRGIPKMPALWKNGIRQEITLPPDAGIARLTSLFVDGNDVWAAGFACDNPMAENDGYAFVMRNGIIQYLLPSGNN